MKPYYDEDDDLVYFDDASLHDHPDWERALYHITHKPLDGYLDDADCQDLLDKLMGSKP